MPNQVEDKKKILLRVRKIKGQTQAIEKALEDNVECGAILQQQHYVEIKTQILAQLWEIFFNFYTTKLSDMHTLAMSESVLILINCGVLVMLKTALYVRLEAKPGKEDEVEAFLKAGLPIVMEEPATVAWFGLRLGPTTFGIFDAFPDEAGRQAHLSGKVAAALMAQADELFSEPPSIEKVDVLASKLPAHTDA